MKGTKLDILWGKLTGLTSSKISGHQNGEDYRSKIHFEIELDEEFL